MRKFTLWILFSVLSLALFAGSNASADVSQDLVQEGRNLAFNGGTPTIAGLVAADLKFQEALESDANNQQAHFFRAITRVLVAVAQEGAAVPLLTMPDLMEAFGFSWEDTGPPPPDPATPLGDDFLTSLNASLVDLAAVSDTFSVTLMSNQNHEILPEITISYGDVLVLLDMMQAISDFVNPSTWDILDLKQLIANDSTGLLTEEQRVLLYQFVNPFGYNAVPGTPTIGAVTAGNTQATVNFTAPANNGGSAITGYTVTSNPGNKTATGLSIPLTVAGLTNGTAYTFTVKATNVAGNSTASAASSSVTPRTVPGAPAIGTVTVGTVTAGLFPATASFTAPASNGGSAITSYTVTATSTLDSKTKTGPSSPLTVTGLTNGRAYTFTVKATNVAGSSADSAKWYSGGSGNDTFTGTLGNDTINGLAGNDIIKGLAGNDILNGGIGADTMTGDDGSDTYYVDNASDKVTENNAAASTGGTDIVYSSLSTYTLPANVENGRVMLTGAANLIGNTLNNVLYAGAGNNVLNGGAGSDTADYTYAGSAVKVSLAITTAQATGGSGSDTLTAIEKLTGSKYNDTLTGNAAANVLDGGTGIDILDGGAGIDTMTGGAGNDTFVFKALTEMGTTSTTCDIITDFVSGQDKIDLSKIDANAATPANDAFTSIIAGTAAFTAPRQLKLSGGVLYGNTDADAAAEFAIKLNKITTVTPSNFIL